MIKTTIGELARMCGGVLSSGEPTAADRRIAGVSTDSRKLHADQLFIPLIGKRFDGHEYAAVARVNGAAAALWQADRPVPDALRDWPLIIVDDTLAALQRLAAAYRQQLPVRIVGITGSNGKTTTKDMVAAVLATVFRVHKTAGNLNNHIGLPLTLLEMDETTEAAVLEMGMSGFGEIELLSTIAKPDAAVITNIGDAHLLQLGSREGIAKAKLEIAAGLKPEGLFVYNGDEPLLRDALTAPDMSGSFRKQSFGAGECNDWQVTIVAMDAAGTEFGLRSAGQSNGSEPETMNYRIPVPGGHNVYNAAAAIAVAADLGVPADRIRQGLAGLKLSAMRLESIRAYNGATVLNDAFNANPTAMRAAVDTVAAMTGYRRKWLVLGDMLELGPEETRLHREIGAYINPEKAGGLLTYGTLGRSIAEGAAANFPEASGLVLHFEDKTELTAWLRDRLHPDDLVLVKGSRGMQMEKIVHELEQ
ncbi:UDP-N-acetylmuramoyl-tripeptide--D-alanyl-D-alanine ligase [Paenibacillus tarimensis]